MGNNLSTPPPAPAPPVPVVTLPVQRVPVQDGASGLHYSGRTYMTQYPQLASDICKGASVSATQVGDVMPNGVSTTTLPIDPGTKRISATALQGYVEGLVTQGVIPGKAATLDAQIVADKKFYAGLQAEYCFYEPRYVAALTQLLTLMADPNGADAKTLQTSTNTVVGLNARLNSLLEIANYLANTRASAVAARGTAIDAANAGLDDKIARLSQQREALMTDEGRIQTQREMMRYSAEKGRAMNIQIMFFVALNVVALGTVLSVYRGVGGGGG